MRPKRAGMKKRKGMEKGDEITIEGVRIECYGEKLAATTVSPNGETFTTIPSNLSEHLAREYKGLPHFKVMAFYLSKVLKDGRFFDTVGFIKSDLQSAAANPLEWEHQELKRMARTLNKAIEHITE